MQTKEEHKNQRECSFLLSLNQEWREWQRLHGDVLAMQTKRWVSVTSDIQILYQLTRWNKMKVSKELMLWRNITCGQPAPLNIPKTTVCPDSSLKNLASLAESVDLPSDKDLRASDEEDSLDVLDDLFFWRFMLSVTSPGTWAEPWCMLSNKSSLLIQMIIYWAWILFKMLLVFWEQYLQTAIC